MTFSRLLGAALVLAVLSARTGSAEPTREQRLERGEILIDTHPVPGTSLPEVVVTAVINAEPGHVWPIIDQCNDYKRTLLRVKESHELSRVGTTVRCEVTIDAPWPMKDLHSISVAQHVVTADHWSRTWTLESGDYKYNGGAWTLTWWAGGRTLLEYRLHSEPKVSIPVLIQKLAMQTALPDLIKKIRSEVR